MVYLVVSVKSWLTKEPNTKRPNVLYISLLSRATLNIYSERFLIVRFVRTPSVFSTKKRPYPVGTFSGHCENFVNLG